jgi:glycosyltransferase involved in cell wall biosynthesis
MPIADPLVSVVMPARNAATTIEEQLASLSRQTATVPWEVIVCDNGSTDTTPQLIRTWESRIPRLHLVNAFRANGAGETRNLGVAAATASLIAFCDADDVVADDWLEQILLGLAQAPFIGCMSDMSSLNSRRAPGETSGPLYRWQGHPHLPFASSRAMALRKDVFEAVGGFHSAIRVGEDVDLSWRIQLAGFHLSACPAAIVRVRQRDALLAELRQSYAFGRAERQLQLRFATISPPDRAGWANMGDARANEAVPRTLGTEPMSHPASSSDRRRKRRDPRPFLMRRAHAIGYRFGNLGTRMARYTDGGADEDAGQP